MWRFVANPPTPFWKTEFRELVRIVFPRNPQMRIKSCPTSSLVIDQYWRDQYFLLFNPCIGRKRWIHTFGVVISEKLYAHYEILTITTAAHYSTIWTVFFDSLVFLASFQANMRPTQHLRYRTRNSTTEVVATATILTMGKLVTNHDDSMKVHFV